MSIHAGKRWVWNTACQNSAGNEPPFGKILAYDSRIEGIYVNGTGAGLNVPAEDKFVTPALMTRIRSFGLLAGAWFVPRSTNAVGEASRAASMVTFLNPDCVLLDVETHDLVFQRAFVAEYRRLKPGRATDVTFEPRQSASSVAAAEYVAARMCLYPQLYNAQMRPADAENECKVWSGLVGWGNFHLFLDARLDWWWLGACALFSAETLLDKRTLRTRVLTVAPCGDETGEETA